MIFISSVKSIYRTPRKTALFCLLILVLTLILGLGLSLWSSVGSFLTECDNSYMTIALLEYMGAEYPDESVYDAGMAQTIEQFDFSIITGNEALRLWDRSVRALGFIDGYTRSDSSMPYRQAGVIVVGDIGSAGDDETMRSGVIRECLYSYRDMEGKFVYIDTAGYPLQSGHIYLLHGEFYYGRSSYPHFRITRFHNAAASAAGFAADEASPVSDVTDGDGYSLDHDSCFYQFADTYHVVNNSVSVYATAELNSLLAFHQQLLYIEQGRSFTREEYQNGAAVCVISGLIADKCGVGLGDRIPLSLAVAADTPVNETYWAGTGFSQREEYEVVGITNAPAGMGQNVYIPAKAATDLGVNQIGYTIGQAVLVNSKADEFYEAVLPLLPNRVRLTLYDQGYSAVGKPFGDILRIVIVVTIVCAAVSLAALALFGYLFVYRQRDASQIMMLLGTGRFGVFRYFLYSSGLIALFSAGAGSAAGYLLSGWVNSLVHRIIERYSLSDTRFSNGSLTVVKTLQFAPHPDPMLFVMAALGVLTAALCVCLLFTLGTFVRNRPKRRRTTGPRKAGHTSRLPGTPLKYSLLSILRGGARSFVVPIVSIAVVIFLAQLSNTADSYEAKLGEINASSVISGYFTDINGRQISDLTLEAYNLHDLSCSGFIRDLVVSQSRVYHYLGRSRVNGEEQYVPPLEVPQSGFAAETLHDNICRGDDLVFTDDLSATAEFFYSNIIETGFMTGYDESMLAGPLADTPCCIVSSAFMEAKGIGYGDTIRLVLPTQNIYKYIPVDLKVVGSFEKQGNRDHIYCQLAAYMEPDMLRDPGLSAEALYRYTLQSARFQLADSSRLSQFKAYLQDQGYSEARRIGSVRSFIVLEDKIFLGTVSALSQQIRYIHVLYPCLYILAGIIGFVVCYLLIASRRKEFAVMGGLGAPRLRIFLSFFCEQLALCLLGCALGVGACVILRGAVTPLQIMLTAGFILCYLTGAILSITVTNRPSVVHMLTDED